MVFAQTQHIETASENLARRRPTEGLLPPEVAAILDHAGRPICSPFNQAEKVGRMESWSFATLVN